MHNTETAAVTKGKTVGCGLFVGRSPLVAVDGLHVAPRLFVARRRSRLVPDPSAICAANVDDDDYDEFMMNPNTQGFAVDERLVSEPNGC